MNDFQEILYSGPIPNEEININWIHCKNMPKLTQQLLHFYDSVSKQGNRKAVIVETDNPPSLELFTNPNTIEWCQLNLFWT